MPDTFVIEPEPHPHDPEGDRARVIDHLSMVCGRVYSLWPIGDIQTAVERGTYIAGGAVVNTLLDIPVVDYDFFVRDEATRDLILTLFSTSGDLGCEVRAKTQNGITLKLPTGEIIQIVTRFLGPPSRIFKSFDFEHCKAYFDYKDYSARYNVELIKKKLLVYTGEDDYPLNTLKRLVKFIRRGWTIENESIMNLALKLSKTNLTDPAVRAEQSIGFYGSSME